MATLYLHGGDQVSSWSEITLPGRVETLLKKIYGKHNHRPIKVETRRRLSSIFEELALESLRKVFNTEYVRTTLDGLVIYFINNVTVNVSPRLSSGVSPVQSSNSPGKRSCRSFQELSLDGKALFPKILKREENRGSKHSPQLLALGELEFKKAFMLLSYIGGKPLVEAVTADEIRQWKDFPMVKYESAVWFKLRQRNCSQKERRVWHEWDSGKTLYYRCHVSPDGSYRFKNPLVENTGTHLHKVLGDENVLTVEFDEVSKDSTYCTYPYSSYKRIAKNGIMVGLRRYQFFVFKDGGKEEKGKEEKGKEEKGKKEKGKNKSTKRMKCYFIRTGSEAFSDMGKPYIFSGMSIHKARMHFMHVHTLPSLANYMARFSLILSNTKMLEVDMTGINFEKIGDIHCHDQNNYDVLDKNGKPCIHSDGTGYISEDLARMCPIDTSKGNHIKSDKIKGICSQDPPLLIQFRMFYKGYAVKGTFLLNKKIPSRTVQVRPSMIKVTGDPTLSNVIPFNALEVVNTSNPPKITRLSKNLVVLLSYGGVPDDFFLDILHRMLEKSKTIFFNPRAAGRAALNYGERDDKNALQMIMAGIPLDEPYLKHYVSKLLKTEKKYLKAGRLPVTESYYLMGTVDPTGELKEDEVCVILDSGQMSGNVLVYRNPGLHFGDIHILKARYVEAMDEYVGNSKYAVFFPQKGPRSLGDEIAGGDFDGDMYFVSRNPELLRHYKPSEPWVSSSHPSKVYTRRKPSELSPEELEEELFKMFLKTRFHASKVVGQAADSWLSIMDRFLTSEDEKAKAEMKKKILKLIDIYYDALDAPKKGIEINLPFDVKIETFPHYMEREKQFESTSILGKIYDKVVSESAEEPPQSDEPVSEFHMEESECFYKNYRDEMSPAMKPDKDLADEILQRYKQVFYGAAGFKESKKSLEELYPKALALYKVSYNHAIKWKNFKACGFVWNVAGPVLCRFYEKNPILCSTSVLKEMFG